MDLDETIRTTSKEQAVFLSQLREYLVELYSISQDHIRYSGGGGITIDRESLDFPGTGSEIGVYFSCDVRDFASKHFPQFLEDVVDTQDIRGVREITLVFSLDGVEQYGHTTSSRDVVKYEISEISF